MLFRTHMAFAFLFGLLMIPFYDTGNLLVYFVFVFIGAALPDIDESNSKISRNIPILPKLIGILSKHRGVFHSLWFAILLPALIYLTISKSVAYALFVGYLSHLLIDCLTVAGLNLLHPISKLHVSGFIETGTIPETVLFGILIAFDVLKVVKLF